MLRLKKDLNVYDFDWNPELQKNEETLLSELDILHFIREPVEIEEGFTLRHYFEFIKKWEILQIFDKFFPSFIKEYETTCRAPGFKMEYDNVDYIILKKITERDRWEYAPGQCFINESIDISGVGLLEEDDEHTRKKGDVINYAIEFSSLDKLIDLEIRLETHKIRINEKDFSFTEYEGEDVNITLFDFIKEVIWELSFIGTPEQRDKQRKEILETKDEIEELVKNGDIEKLKELFPEDFED